MTLEEKYKILLNYVKELAKGYSAPIYQYVFTFPDIARNKLKEIGELHD